MLRLRESRQVYETLVYCEDDAGDADLASTGTITRDLGHGGLYVVSFWMLRLHSSIDRGGWGKQVSAKRKEGGGVFLCVCVCAFVVRQECERRPRGLPQLGQPFATNNRRRNSGARSTVVMSGQWVGEVGVRAFGLYRFGAPDDSGVMGTVREPGWNG